VRIALWNIDPFSGSKSLLEGIGWGVQHASPSDCGRMLLEGEVDVALVPSIEVLRHTDAFMVLPDVAFASRRGFPLVGLALSKQMSEIRSIVCTADTEPFFGIASMILREQYEQATSLVRAGQADAALLLGAEATAVDDASKLDLGQEWFEMTGTPLSWGFFAARPGTTPNRALRDLQEALVGLIRGAGLDAATDAADPDQHSTYRAQFDPEVADGVDELAHYLFYMGILDDIPALRLMAGQN